MHVGRSEIIEKRELETILQYSLMLVDCERGAIETGAERGIVRWFRFRFVATVDLWDSSGEREKERVFRRGCWLAVLLRYTS